jgi:hypothetical protein
MISSLVTSIDSRLVTGRKKELFSVQDHEQKRYEWSSWCWAQDLDLSAVSVWNDSINGGPLRQGTLITPNVVALAAHYNYGVGTTVRWACKDRPIVEERKVVAAQRAAVDIWLCALDRPLEYVKPLPIPNNETLRALLRTTPVIVVDQERKALVGEIFSAKMSRLQLGIKASSPMRQQFYESKVIHDSGGAVIAVREKTLILLGHLTYGGAGAGPSYGLARSSIERTIETLTGSPARLLLA